MSIIYYIMTCWFSLLYLTQKDPIALRQPDLWKILDLDYGRSFDLLILEIKLVTVTLLRRMPKGNNVSPKSHCCVRSVTSRPKKISPGEMKKKRNLLRALCLSSSSKTNKETKGELIHSSQWSFPREAKKKRDPPQKIHCQRGGKIVRKALYIPTTCR